MKPNDELKQFHHEHCPDLPIDSSNVFNALMEEIKKLKQQGVSR